MLSEPENSFQKIAQARRPEDLFGQLSGSPEQQLKEVHQLFRALVKIVSPDVNADTHRATEIFKRLKELSEQATASIRAGTYGHSSAVTIQTHWHSYLVGEALDPVGVGGCYKCLIDGTSSGVFAIAQTPPDNDLLFSEAVTLSLLRQPDRPEAKGYLPMLPTLIESFRCAEASGTERRANVFETTPGYVSIKDIYTAYPAGVHAKDMAWIWRRLLDILGYAHSRGVIHGAVLPVNVLVGTGDIHEIILINWQAATQQEKNGATSIPIMDFAFQDWYPPEVEAKQPPTPGIDILMSARCMVALLGGDPVSGKLPSSIPRRIAGFIASCLLISPAQRPQSAWHLREEFTEMIDTLWGKREYRPLTLPK